MEKQTYRIQAPHFITQTSFLKISQVLSKTVYKEKLTNPFECLMLKSGEGTKSFRELADFQCSFSSVASPVRTNWRQAVLLLWGPAWICPELGRNSPRISRRWGDSARATRVGSRDLGELPEREFGGRSQDDVMWCTGRLKQSNLKHGLQKKWYNADISSLLRSSTVT